MIDKQEDSRQTARTAVFNTIANVISLIVGMIMIPIITRVISAQDLGIASTFLSTRNILVLIVTCSVYTYVHRAMLEYPNEKKDYINSITIFCIFTVIISFFVCRLIKTPMQKLLSLDEFLFYWLFFSMLSIAVYTIGYNYCVFHNKYKIVSTIVLCTGPVSQVLAVVLSFVMPKHKYIGRVLGLDFMYVLVTICVFGWLFLGNRKKFQKKYIQRTLNFSIPIIPHMLSQMVLTQCDLIMITYFCGGTDSGIYSMAHTIGFLAFTVMSQIMATWSPWVYRRLEEKDRETVRNNSGIMVLISTYLTIGLVTVSPELIRIFLTKEYLPCIYIVPPLVVGMFFQIIYLFFYDIEYYYKKPKWIALFSTIACVCNVVLNYLLIPQIGSIAAAYSTVFSYFVLMVLNGAFSMKFGARKTYKMKSMLAAILGVIVYTVTATLLVDRLLIRYGLLVGITIVLFVFEFKRIREFLMGLKAGGK